MQSSPVAARTHERSPESALQPIFSFAEHNAQIEDGKLRYAVAGSGAILLFTNATELKAHLLINDDGELVDTELPDLYRTQAHLKANADKFGLPSDIDISSPRKVREDNQLVEDHFTLAQGSTILSGKVLDKEYFFLSPFDYVIKMFANKYTDALFGGSSFANKKYKKLNKIETVIEAGLASRPIEDLAQEIEKEIELIVGQESHKNGLATSLLSDPEKMYRLLAQSLFRTNEGTTEMSININMFPKTKELIQLLSSNARERTMLSADKTGQS